MIADNSDADLLRRARSQELIETISAFGKEIERLEMAGAIVQMQTADDADKQMTVAMMPANKCDG